MGAAAILWGLVRGVRTRYLHRLSVDRLAPLSGRAVAAEARLDRWSTFPRRHLILPWLAGILVGVCLYFLAGWPLPFAGSLGLITALLGTRLEAYLAQRAVARIEAQLADAIDLVVGALEAGASVGTALDAAAQEFGAPLRPQLEHVTGRIRFGDDPGQVFRGLAERVPLETFLLFSSALAVHWEVGGRLAPTLATVSRTIRDRIEISRRIRSNAAYAQASTVAVLCITYFIAAIVWRDSPERMARFLSTTVGSGLVVATILLQALGIIWMSIISRTRF
jgi:Flp pilus assembly protein TadB